MSWYLKTSQQLEDENYFGNVRFIMIKTQVRILKENQPKSKRKMFIFGDNDIVDYNGENAFILKKNLA